ncbi:MAG TPA: GNAT family N-acetyltransferase [Candidatus Angelobacter sp.]|jgi:GNAT superfamily N-acetyltransferase|nr:GNAT family N-acetyltransferase [Candidatus Angelobacter sp.]
MFVRKLDPTDATGAFDCGDAAMNEYFHRYAKKNQGHLFGVTYVCILPPSHLIGFYTIANTTIPRAGIPDELLRGLPKYQDLPAILLGRLAVDRRAQGKKIGELLISHCFDVCLQMTTICGARYVITDAYQSAGAFYEKYGFRRVQGSANPGTIKMFLDLKVVRAAIDLRGKEGIAH